MLRVLSTLVLCCAAAHASAQAEPPPPEEPKASVREAVDAGNYFFLKAFEARDAQTIAELYTEHGRVLAPGAEPANGRAAIAAFWAGSMQTTKSVRLETLSVESDGDFAVEDGVVYLTANDESESSARYVVVWKRVGRRWYMHRDIWNAGPAAPAPALPVEAPPAPTEGEGR